jgi:hypothetical protein
MREELEQKLMNDFPFMEARNVWTGEKLGYPMPIECSDGWFNLIYDLCSKIQKVLDKESPEFVEGFYPIQIKSKYASLRFYTTYGNDEMFKLIDEAERESETICEKCGQPGEVRPGGWITTLCDECYKK